LANDGNCCLTTANETATAHASQTFIRTMNLRLPSSVLLLFLGGSLLQAEPPVAGDLIIRRNLMVPMRDGVKLATDVYLPARDGKPAGGKLPVILTRLPYDKNGAKKQGEYFARNGYAFVAQDTRGRYGSEGVWHMMTDDGRDGVDCAAWITRQPWSDGKIGMIGTSYVGGTQHAMAMERAPGLVTVIPVDAVSNPGAQSMRNAGAFELRFWNWIMLNAGRGSRASRDPATATILREMADNRLHYLENLPLRRGTTPLQFAPEYEDWLVEAMRHGANDAFWEQNNILEHADRYKDIPVYLVGGWYDSWAGNTVANYTALSNALKSDVYLIMGPWIHGQQARSAHGQVDFGKDAAIPDELAWRLEWYDHWLKGKDNAVGKAAPFSSKVRIFVMGTGDGHKTENGLLFHGGQWRDETGWPLARARNTPFFFGHNGALSSEKPPATGGATSFTFDPRNPVPTIGGNISSGDGLLVQGAWDQRGGPHLWNWTKPIPLAARNDVVCFQTAPLGQDLEVTGPLEVKLWVSSTAVDTDFTAKLLDIYPPSADWPGGFDLNIADGIARMRFRDSLKEEHLMEPGRIHPVTIKLYPSSNVFKKGHRIRVDVSSSNFPRFDINPNTGEPLNDHRRMITAVNTIHHDAEHPSHIILPVVPTGGTAQYDLLIKNARIADGTGAPLSNGSIAVRDGRIAEVGDVKGSAVTEIDAGGRVAAPGFIDVHTHSERIARLPAAENFVRMGVTTIVTGNCGGSRTDVAKFFDEIAAAHVAINVATLIGHNSVRREAMGGNFSRPPAPGEMERMKAIVDQAMREGAVGLSTGLIYLPGTFAKTEEIVALAKVASAHGGIYASHMRAETVKIFDALEELFRIAREAGIRAEVSHLKLSSPTAWGKADEVLAMLDRARAEGLSITHDLYAYTASSTGLAQLIPDNAREGTRDDFRARISDPGQKAQILEEMRKTRERQGRTDYSYAVIARFDADPSLNGKTIPEAAKIRRGSDSLDDQIELILELENQGGASGVYHNMDEPDLQAFLRHPLTMVASDGGPTIPSADIPHPRNYGNNARVLGRYVRDLKILPLEEAIRRMTSLPARTFRLKDRGILKPGAFADIVIFDPERVNDPATFAGPHHYADGFTDVIVNGGVVLRAGEMTGVRSGGPLRLQSSP
jgi:putative CocE/NonD family hydrolase